jgi:hypothetical protein
MDVRIVRTVALVIVAAAFPLTALGQEHVSMSAKAVIEGEPIVSVTSTSTDVPSRAPVHRGALGEAIATRLRPLVDQVKQDARFQQTGAVAGLASIVVGAWSGKPSLTAAGAHALHFGLEQPLSSFQRRSGLSVEPTVGPGRFVIRLRRTFD